MFSTKSNEQNSIDASIISRMLTLTPAIQLLSSMASQLEEKSLSNQKLFMFRDIVPIQVLEDAKSLLKSLDPTNQTENQKEQFKSSNTIELNNILEKEEYGELKNFVRNLEYSICTLLECDRCSVRLRFTDFKLHESSRYPLERDAFPHRDSTEIFKSSSDKDFLRKLELGRLVVPLSGSPTLYLPEEFDPVLLENRGIQSPERVRELTNRDRDFEIYKERKMSFVETPYGGASFHKFVTNSNDGSFIQGVLHAAPLGPRIVLILDTH